MGRKRSKNRRTRNHGACQRTSLENRQRRQAQCSLYCCVRFSSTPCRYAGRTSAPPGRIVLPFAGPILRGHVCCCLRPSLAARTQPAVLCLQLGNAALLFTQPARRLAEARPLESPGASAPWTLTVEQRISESGRTSQVSNAVGL